MKTLFDGQNLCEVIKNTQSTKHPADLTTGRMYHNPIINN